MASEMIRGYTQIQRDLLEAAELMPEADYGFKPTPETRPFGELIAHVALSQFGFCSFLQGGPSPKAAEKEETPRSKAVLIALLKESTTHAFTVPFVCGARNLGDARRLCAQHAGKIAKPRQQRLGQRLGVLPRNDPEQHQLQQFVIGEGARAGGAKPFAQALAVIEIMRLYIGGARRLARLCFSRCEQIGDHIGRRGPGGVGLEQ